MRSPTTDTPFFDPDIPRVCIVGRPNVGKSTLFNRLLGRRKAITDPTPGVTRDPVRALWNLHGSPVVLLDTGGLTESKEYLDKLITEKSLKTAQEANVLVLVLDVEEGVTAEDQDFIKRMRHFAERLILVINKVDNEKREQDTWNFHRLGFKPVVPISATHGWGLPELRDALVEKLELVLDRKWVPETPEGEGTDDDDFGGDDSEGEASRSDSETAGPVNDAPARAGKRSARKSAEPAETADTPEDGEDAELLGDDAEFAPRGRYRGPRPLHDGSPRAALGKDEQPAWDISIAILGQPNTGKSTLVNLLTGSDLSLVSPVAGTTRDVIEGSFRFKEKIFRILDTAGIRRRAKVTEDLEYYSVNRALASIEDADVVFLMIDAEKGLTDQDKKIATQIVKHGRGAIMVLNKWDLMQNLPNQFNAVVDRMRFLFPVLGFAPILAISAKEGSGLEELLKKALTIQSQLSTRIDTGRLNNLLRKWVDYTPPPSNRGAARWKLRYMTQISIHPLEFVLFVNKTEGFPDAYAGYIMNKLREECGLREVPFTLKLRSSSARKNDKGK